MKYINDLSEPTRVTETFDGFNGCFGGERSLKRAENLSADAFPLLRPREKRARLGDYGKISAFLDGEVTAKIENGRLYVDGKAVSDEYFTNEYKHRILRLGDYFIVMPEGFYCNAHNLSDFGLVQKSLYTGSGGARLVTVDGEFNEIEKYTVLRTRPDTAEKGDLWAKPKTDGGYEMKRYDGCEWRPCESFIKLESKVAAESFKKGDVLLCKGASEVLGEYIKIIASDGTGIYIEGAAPQGETVSRFSLERRMPLLQQAVAVGGRMLGVYCGYDENGEFVSRVYASALNSPFVWSEYGGGLSADIGGTEEFTELVRLSEDAVAFRKGSVLRIKISDGKISCSETRCEGIGAESDGCAAVIGDSVCYKAPTAIYKYSGSFPERISDGLSGVDLCRNEGTPVGACNGKFYVRLADKSGKHGIYAYSTKTKLWSVEDDPGVKSFFMSGNGLVAVCDKGDGSSLVLFDYESVGETLAKEFTGNGYPAVESAVRWSFETESINANIKKGLYPSRIFLKARLKAGASLGAGCICGEKSLPDRTVSVSDGVDGYFEIPLLVSKSRSVRLSVFGRGDAEVLGYAVEYTKG